MTMRISLALLSLFVFMVPAPAASRLSAVSGPVEVQRMSAPASWSPAAAGTDLSPADRIRTGAGGRAIILHDETSRIWVAPSSELVVPQAEQPGVFSLLAGKLRAKVKLMANRRFAVRTPVAVASVRGTEFVVESQGTVAVLEGVVSLGQELGEQMREIAAGYLGTFSAAGVDARELSALERTALEGDWAAFEQGLQTASAGDQARFDEMRQELRSMVADMKTDLSLARELTNEIKESDISTGRTLRDMHGNLVRVEQHILRPDDSTLEFLNLTKRTEYAYRDVMGTGWTYAGPAGSRLDSMDVTMTMNKPLPEQLSDWPAYISAQGDDLHPSTVKVVMTNQDDRIEFRGDWRLKGQADSKGRPLSDDQLVFSSYINGWLVNESYEPKNDQNARYRTGDDHDGNDAGQLWAWSVSPDLEVTKDGQTKYVNLYTQIAVINNNGSILAQSDFTSASENPFTLLKQVAGEHVTFCRERSGADFFRKGNLDLVITPDAVIAVAQKLATQVGDLKKDSSAQ